MPNAVDECPVNLKAFANLPADAGALMPPKSTRSWR